MPVRPADSPPKLATASWFTRVPNGFMRINISRGPPPNGIDMNTLRYAALVPSVNKSDTPPELFHRLYVNRIAALDPEFVFEQLRSMCGERVPVLCGWTTPESISKGKGGCHRHLAADWFERAMDIKVPEIGAPPAFDRFQYWRIHPIAPSVPGDRPRTHKSIPDKPSARAIRRLAQGSFKF